jgi:hypothetical protein
MECDLSGTDHIRSQYANDNIKQITFPLHKLAPGLTEFLKLCKGVILFYVIIVIIKIGFNTN